MLALVTSAINTTALKPFKGATQNTFPNSEKFRILSSLPKPFSKLNIPGPGKSEPKLKKRKQILKSNETNITNITIQTKKNLPGILDERS